MEQVALYLDGESDYVKLKGGTGPLVYPAGHVYVYSLLYKITDQGRDIWKAQCVFVGLYLLMLAVVLVVYIKAKVCGPNPRVSPREDGWGMKLTKSV